MTDEDATCLALWHQGKTNQHIADTLERSLTWVKIRTRNVKREAGISRRLWTATEDRQMLRMLRAGKSHAEIAEKLGRARGTIASRFAYIKKRDAKPAPDPKSTPPPAPVVFRKAPPKPVTFTADQDARLRSYMADGLGIGSAAALLRIPRDQVANRWAEIGMQEAAE